MGKQIGLFIFFFALSFAGGYVFYHSGGPSQEQAQSEDAAGAQAASATATAPAPATATATASSKEGEIFTQRGCIQCHSISALGIKAGQVGPDLSQAYTTVEAKHGEPIEEFLKKPTSAVMSGVLGQKPLTDDERKAVLKALKLASEKK